MDRVAALTRVAELVRAAATDRAGLTRAVDTARREIAELPEREPDRAFRQFLLATMMRARGESTDLDQAIGLIRASAGDTTDDPAWRSEYHTGLATLLVERTKTTGASGGLEEVLSSVETALALTPVGHPHHAKRTTALGVIVRQCALAARDPAILGQAIALHQTAVETAHPDDPRRGRYLTELAMTQFAQHLLGPNRLALRASRRTLRQAARLGHPYDKLTPLVRLNQFITRKVSRQPDQAPSF